MSCLSFASCSKDSSRVAATSARAYVDQPVLDIKIQKSSTSITWHGLNLRTSPNNVASRLSSSSFMHCIAVVTRLRWNMLEPK